MPLLRRLRGLKGLWGAVGCVGIVVGLALLGDAFRRYSAAFFIAWASLPLVSFFYRRSEYATLVPSGTANRFRALLMSLAVILSFCAFANDDHVRDTLGYRYVQGYYVDSYEDYDSDTGQPYLATDAHADRSRDFALLEFALWVYLAACIGVPWVTWRYASAVCAMAERRKQAQPQQSPDAT